MTEAASKIGAVNCIKLENQQLLGENTDGKGFLESLETVIDQGVIGFRLWSGLEPDKKVMRQAMEDALGT